jgi:hypothetical protein
VELHQRDTIASAFTHPKNPDRQISATLAGPASAGVILRAMRVHDERLFEVFAFRAKLRILTPLAFYQKSLLCNQNKIRRLSVHHEPHSSGHIYQRWTP